MHWHNHPSRPPSDEGHPAEPTAGEPEAWQPGGQGGTVISDPGQLPPADPEPEARPHRGRPRSTEADAAIAEATLRLLARVGYEGVSIEGVAAAAGVGKTTVYRRYKSKTELVLATIARVDAAAGPPPREALATVKGARDAIRFMMNGAAVIVSTPGVLPALSNLAGGPGMDTELASSIRGQVFGPNIELLRGRIEAGKRAGEIRRDVDVDTAIDIGFGALIARRLLGGAIDQAWLDALLDMIWRGIGARAEAPEEGRGDGSGPSATAEA